MALTRVDAVAKWMRDGDCVGAPRQHRQMKERESQRRVVEFLPVNAPESLAFAVRGRVVRTFSDGSMDIEDLDSPHKLRWIPNAGYILEELGDGRGR